MNIEKTWHPTTLGVISTFTNGGAWNADLYVESGIRVVRVTDCKGGTVDISGCKYLPETLLSKYRKHVLEQGDLIIATVGSHPTQPGSVVGRPTIVPKDAHGALLNQNAVCVRPTSNSILDKRFLAHLAKSSLFREYIVSCARGSANQVRMAIELLKEMPIWLPPLPTQRKIAAILSAYDDLIENNLRRIKILEEMAQNLYREWFVKFRFPGHEQAKFVNSPLGMIPEGWEIVSAPQAIQVRPSIPVPKTSEIPFIPMGSLSESSMIIGEVEYRTEASGARFQNGDTLFARITPCLENGKTGFVQFLSSNDSVACGSTEFIVLRSKTLCPEYVYLMARSDPFRDNAIKSMSGATGRQRVNEKCFEQFLLAQPPLSIIEDFHAIVHSQFKLIYVLNQKNANLRRTRDVLLPKLISGEVDVSAIDIAVPLEAEP